jgi:large subunit ribosomal protein L25
MANELQAEKRDESGKGAAHKLRAGGRVPGVLYGHGMDPVPLSVDAREMRHILHTGAGTNVLIDLEVDGKQHLTLPREIQQDHIHDRVMHVDFLVVRRDEKISVNVELIDIGDAPGVKQGGVVDHHLRELHIECLPQDVPEHIEVDISGLDLGDIVHVSDLVAPKGVTILNSPDETVLAVITPAALKTEAELTVPGEEAAPVEVPEEAEEGEGEPDVEAASGEPAAEEGGES